jgi:hypothetical protein
MQAATPEPANTAGTQKPSAGCYDSLLAKLAKELSPGSYVELPTKWV